jgi:hypothetical protein
MKTPYDVLGVAPDADEKAIASAFREAAKACHPDVNPENRAAEAQFKAIVAARNALNDPERRALYRFVELSRRAERRHWIITIASCAVSALVSAGLVGMFPQEPASEPAAEAPAPALIANSTGPSGDEPRFALAARSSDASIIDRSAAARTEPPYTQAAQPQPDGSREQLAAFGMARAPDAPALAPLPPESSRETTAAPPRDNAQTRRGAKAPPHREVGRGARIKDPGKAFLSLLGRAVRPRAAEARPRRTVSRMARTQSAGSGAAGSTGCWSNQDGMRATPCMGGE